MRIIQVMILAVALLSASMANAQALWSSVGSTSDDIYNTQLGNVGIGTNNPTVRLDVNGSLKVGGPSFHFGSTAQTGQLVMHLKQSTNAGGGWNFGYGANNSNDLYLYGYENANYTIYTNSLARFRVASDGNVGIGTTSPAHKLEVDGTIRGTGKAIFGNSSSYGWVINPDGAEIDALYSYRASGGMLVANNGPLYLMGKHDGGQNDNVILKRKLRINSDNDGLDGLELTPNAINTRARPGTTTLSIGANAITTAFFDDAGRLGIGTTSPAYKLDVNGTGRFTGNVSMLSYSATATSYLYTGAATSLVTETSSGNAGIQIRDNIRPSLTLDLSGVISRGIGIINSSGDIGINVPTFSGPTTHIFYGNGDFYSYGNGSFGDGGIASSAVLTANSTTKGFLPPRMTATQRSAISSPATGLVVYQTDGTEGLYQYKSSGWSAVGSGGGSSQWTTTGSDIYYNSGNVGIGVTTPAYKLAVSGTTHLNGEVSIGAVTTFPATGNYKLAVAGNVIAEKVRVKLQSSIWPDYVFKPSYNLPTLPETEQFIKANSHLPGVPSAKEIEKEGLDLGDGQAVLLKKIEEMTLHMIEMNKRLEKLEAENAAMKKKSN